MLIVNSFASSVTARNTVVVHRRLSEGARSLTGGSVRRHNVEVVETNRRGHATRFANDAARRGVDVVIGYGGDGTLNEVATGIAGTNSALGGIYICIIIMINLLVKQFIIKFIIWHQN